MMVVFPGGLAGGLIIVVSGASGAGELGLTIVVSESRSAGGAIHMKYAISNAATTISSVTTIAVVE